MTAALAIFAGQGDKPALVLMGPPFHVQVWKALLTIPEGETTSYGEVAARAGKPGAFRATGAAIGANPIIVTIGKEGKVSLGSDATTIEALVDGVHTLMGDDLTRVVHVRGDNDAVYGEVVKVMDRLASNGITHIAIMTNSRKQADAAGSDAAASSSPTLTTPAAAPAAAAV